MKISAIKQQVKRADRYSIYVDNAYAFSLSESALLESGIASGQELDEASLQEYRRLSADDKAYNGALRYAAMRPRSEWELRTYLRRKEADEPVMERIVSKLRRIGLLDDEVFARSWVENRRLIKPTSTRKLELELRQKHVSDAVIRETLQTAAPDREALRQVIAKKRRLTRFRDDRDKLMQYLARQGFGYDDIKNELHDMDSE